MKKEVIAKLKTTIWLNSTPAVPYKQVITDLRSKIEQTAKLRLECNTDTSKLEGGNRI